VLCCTLLQVTTETEELRFNTAIAAMMEFINGVYKWDNRWEGGGWQGGGGGEGRDGGHHQRCGRDVEALWAYVPVAGPRPCHGVRSLKPQAAVDSHMNLVLH
jgi:hypothetical protein